MVFKDYYKILGLSSPKVTLEEIKLAYRNQAKTYHPDVNSGHDEIIKDINEAYNVLIDAKKKKQYDRLWTSYVAKGKALNQTYKRDKKTTSILDELTSVFFGTVFEEKKKKVSKEELNEYINLSIPMAEAYLGTKKTIVKNGKEIELEIPARTLNNTNIVIDKKGKKNPSNGEVGNLVFNINYSEFENYKQEGLNLVKTIELLPSNFVLGKSIEEDIFGEKIAVILPENTPNGKKFVIKNKGFVSKTNQKGDFIMNFIMKTPETISEEERKLYQEIQVIEEGRFDDLNKNI